MLVIRVMPNANFRVGVLREVAIIGEVPGAVFLSFMSGLNTCQTIAVAKAEGRHVLLLVAGVVRTAGVGRLIREEAGIDGVRQDRTIGFCGGYLARVSFRTRV